MKLSLSSFLALDPQCRHLVELLAFTDGVMSSNIVYGVLENRFHASNSACERIINRLEDMHIVETERNYGYFNKVRLATLFSMDAIKVMAGDLFVGRQVKNPKEIMDIWRRRGFYMVQDELDMELEALEFLGRVIGGNCCGNGIVERNEYIESATASRFISLTDEEPELDESNVNASADGFTRYWLNLAFALGRDMRRTMATVEAWIKAKRDLSPDLVMVYCSLCAWMGNHDGLELSMPSAIDAHREACKTLLSGDIAAAAKSLRDECDRQNGTRLSLPAAFLAIAADTSVKPKKSWPVSIMRRFSKICRKYLTTNTYGLQTKTQYLTALHNIATSWTSQWPHVIDGDGSVVNIIPMDDQTPLVCALLAAYDWHFAKKGRQGMQNAADWLVGYARSIFDLGYVNAAGLVMSLMTGAYDAMANRDITDAIEAKGTWFMPKVAPPPEWANLATMLEKAVDAELDTRQSRRKANDKNKDKTRILWRISFKDPREASKPCEIDSLCACVYRKKTGINKNDVEKATFYGILAGTYARYATDRDKLLAGRMLACTDGYRDTVGRLPTDALPILCDMPNIEEYVSGVGVGTVFRPVKITRAQLRMSLVARDDGGFTLKMPKWMNSVKTNNILAYEGEGRYSYYELSPQEIRLSGTLGRFSYDGAIDLPPDSVDSVVPLIRRVSDIVPVDEPDAGSTGEMKRVVAESRIAVRLDFADGVLSVRAVVVPVNGNSQLVLTPGEGPSEKVVAGAMGSFVLVRNIDEEHARYAPVEEAMSRMDAWKVGEASWEIGDLGAAFEALENLRALDPPAYMEWQKDRKLIVTKVPPSAFSLESFRKADEWFGVEGTFKLDNGKVMSVVQFLDAMRDRKGEYVRLSDGSYLALKKSMVNELEALSAVGRRKGDGLEISKAAIPMLDGVFGKDEDSIGLPEALSKSADEIRSVFAKKPMVPSGLAAKLRPYQKDGFRWLSRLSECGLGACLADDMGLGKTIQVIALLLERSANGASLVVAPASVCGNWRNEIRRFAPGLEPVLAMDGSDDIASAGADSVVIVSYGYMLFHEDELAAREWNGVVLDEAQAIKNEASRRARAVKRLKSKFRIAATGTPVENRLGELWSLFDFLNPGLLGPAASFSSRFASDGKATMHLKKIVRPLILRRLKGEVLKDLPEKTEITIHISLGREERSAYEGCRLHALASLADGGDLKHMRILAELTRLRRFCCHPSLVLGKTGMPSAKMEALVDLLDELKSGGHRALVFSQFVDYLAIVRNVVESHGWSCKYLDGATPTQERGKLVNEFQSGEGDFFLISLKAGGTGLNLTAANYVVLLDPWWNPAVENQAADRTHRIGQTQPVTVYRLVAQDTVEERVVELHERKNEMSADLLDGTSDAKFSTKDLMRLFSESAK